LSIFRSSLIIVGPIGILLLPRVANAVEVGKNSNVKASLEVLLEMVILFSLIVSVSMNLFSREIMVLWLGEVSAVGVWIIKTLILFLPLYLIIEILRSPIDAMSDKGVNSVIYTLAAIILLVSYYIMIRLGFTEVKSGVFSFGCAQLVACVSSYLAVKNKFKISLPNRIFFVVCVLCVALLIIFYQTYNFFFDSGLILIILYAITTFVIISIVLKQFAKQWRIRIKL
jgi:O-antigen/teichoic acid export membrane protein